MKPPKPLFDIHTEADPETTLRQCSSRTAAMRWLREHNLMWDYRLGLVRVGRVVWLDPDAPENAKYLTPNSPTRAKHNKG